ATIAVGAGFNEEGMGFLAHGLQRCVNGVSHMAYVHAVGDHRRHIVALGSGGHFFYRGGARHVSSHAKEIILTNEGDRQLPQGRQVERSMEGTLVNGAITQETKSTAIFSAIFTGKSQAAGEGQVPTYNGMAPIHVIGTIEKMHGPAQASRASGRLAQEFSHAGGKTGASSNDMGVIAVGGDDVIVLARCSQGSNCNGFLADIEVTKPSNFLLLVSLRRTLFKTPNEKHLVEKVKLSLQAGELGGVFFDRNRSGHSVICTQRR